MLCLAGPHLFGSTLAVLGIQLGWVGSHKRLSPVLLPTLLSLLGPDLSLNAISSFLLLCWSRASPSGAQDPVLQDRPCCTPLLSLLCTLPLPPCSHHLLEVAAPGVLPLASPVSGKHGQGFSQRAQERLVLGLDGFTAKDCGLGCLLWTQRAKKESGGVFRASETEGTGRRMCLISSILYALYIC